MIIYADMSKTTLEGNKEFYEMGCKHTLQMAELYFEQLQDGYLDTEQTIKLLRDFVEKRCCADYWNKYNEQLAADLQ